MGTSVTIKIRSEDGHQLQTQKALEHAVLKMQKLVDLISSWEQTSDTSRINQSAGGDPVHVDSHLIRILLKSKEVSDYSKGAFDVTFSSIGKLWKLRPILPQIPTEQEINKALELVDYHLLNINAENNTAQLVKKGMRIDLGGIAKGSVIDQGAKSLLNDGFEDFLINAGGDIRVYTSSTETPWPIGITNPRDPKGDVLATLSLSGGSVVTSGDYEKTVVIDGKRYHHIINPRTGYPVDHCISVTVLAQDAETADAFSTAFFVMGPVKGLRLCEKLDGIEAMFIDNQCHVTGSPGFPEIQAIQNMMNAQFTNLRDFSGKE